MRNVTKLAAATGLLLCAGACDLLGPKKKTTATKVAASAKATSPQARLCAANATYEHLKQSAFDEAKRIRERDTAQLDALADASVIRMERPVLESSDAALGLTVCSGHMVLELPPGAAAAFAGRQRLAADITYSAQPAADGSGTVYKIDGGEPIVYRLASFDPLRSGTRTASADDGGLGEPTPDVRTVVVPAPPMAIPPAPPPPPPPPPPSRTAPSREVQAPDPDIERAHRRLAAQRAAAAAAAQAQADDEERAQAAERQARAERIAAARRIERGDEADDPRPVRTARPSFNCRYARSRVERMICGSDALAARDRAMAQAYYRANELSDAPTRRQLSASRLRFLAYRDRCDSEACVAQAYRDRIDEIRDIAGE